MAGMPGAEQAEPGPLFSQCRFMPVNPHNLGVNHFLRKTRDANV